MLFLFPNILLDAASISRQMSTITENDLFPSKNNTKLLKSLYIPRHFSIVSKLFIEIFYKSLFSSLCQNDQ